MPRYYFHVRKDGHRLDDDDVGQELASAKAAEATAQQIARQLFDEPETYGTYSIVVIDEHGKVVLIIPITER
jgi:hypothetical protein